MTNIGEAAGASAVIAVREQILTDSAIQLFGHAVQNIEQNDWCFASGH